MSLFFKRAEEERAHWFSTAADGPSSKTVTEDNATLLGPVFAAHRHVVDYCSTLPVDVFRRTSAGERISAPTPRLFAHPDEPGGPGLVTWLGQAAYGLLNGNAVGLARETDGWGNPTKIVWLHWSQWDYVEATGQWYVNGKETPSSSIVHIPWIVPPGKRLGLSPIEHYASIVAAGLSAQEYADLKRGGGVPPAHVKNTQRTLPPEVTAAAKKRVAAAFASGEPFVTGADWDLKLLTIPPNHAQFVETLKLSANQIAAIYGIDPTEIGGQAANSLTYSTEELRQINRAANMRPYLTRLEQAFSRMLVEKQFVKFNIDATLRVDLKTRTEVVGAQLQDGRMSVNEARALEDRAPVDGGDFHNVPAPKAEPNTRKDTTS